MAEPEEPSVAEPDRLGAPPRPMGKYAPAVAHHGLVVTAGMTPRRDGVMVVRGRVGEDLDVDAAAAAAGIAAANALSAAAAAVGGVDHISRLLSMTVYVAAGAGFDRLSAVADGASATLSTLLGTAERAAVARAAIGVAALPDGAPVEVQLMAAYDGEASQR